MIEVINYSPEYKDEWDKFVISADNFSFLFLRDYIEYHSDRFKDYSLMIIEDNSIRALLPGNITQNDFISHQGLSYGGLILKSHTSLEKHKLYLNLFLNFLSSININSVTIKLQSYFYSNTQQGALEYILNSNKSFNKTIDLGTHIEVSSHTFPKKCVRKGKLEVYSLQEASDAEKFWPLLEDSLTRLHASKPVHSLHEIEKLRLLFPNHIKFVHLVENSTNMIHAGAALFINNHIVKIQYFAVNQEGRQNRASDVLYYYLINQLKEKYKYIDFGTNMKSDNTINASLLSTKEKFGATIHSVIKYKVETRIFS